MTRNMIVNVNSSAVIWVLLSLVVSVRSFSCCQFSNGTCRSRCEQVSLLSWAQESVSENAETEALVAVRELGSFCPSTLTSFWQCVNSTVVNMMKSASWTGRLCCEKAESMQCQEKCLVAKTKKDLLSGCRRSDEITLYFCVNKVEEGEDCCSNAKTPNCLETCLAVIQSQSTPSTQLRENLTAMCSARSPRVMTCLVSLLRVDRAVNAYQNSHCCNMNAKCAEECHRLLRNRNLTEQDKIDKLSEACGPATVHDLMWQCFLKASEVEDKPLEPRAKTRKGLIGRYPEQVTPVISNSGRSRSIWYPMTTKPVSTTPSPKLERMGLDMAKLQCCEKANSFLCTNICKKTYWRDWERSCAEFESQCLSAPNERALAQCVEDVESPCRAGCEGLSFCSSFNNRPNLHYRSCNAASDLAARQEYELWIREGKIHIGRNSMPLGSEGSELTNSTLTLNIKPVQECLQEHWKALACLLQLKPCHYSVPSNNVCKEDCLHLLGNCLTTSHPSAQTLCDVLAPSYRSQNTCFELTQFVKPSAATENAEVIAPCFGNSCNNSQVCVVGQNAHTCIQGCKLGDLSSVVIPQNTWLRVPTVLLPEKTCSACFCDGSGVISKCRNAPCVNTQSCWLANGKLDHGKTIRTDCNEAICFAGELIFAKKMCQQHADLEEIRMLPCNCPSNRSPVCTIQGKYFQNACLARCYGLLDNEFTQGPCWNQSRTNGDLTLCYSQQCLNKPFKHTRCPAYCRSITCKQDDVICGMDGEIYSRCVASEIGIPIDYAGYCGNPYHECPNVRNCPHLIWYETQCAYCGAGIRLRYSQQQLDTLAQIIDDHKSFSLGSIRDSLQRHVQISYCQVMVYTTPKGELIALFEHQALNATKMQIMACVAESERLVNSVNNRSPWLTADMSLTALVQAEIIYPIRTNSSAFSAKHSLVLYCFVFIFFHLYINIRLEI